MQTKSFNDILGIQQVLKTDGICHLKDCDLDEASLLKFGKSFGTGKIIPDSKGKQITSLYPKQKPAFRAQSPQQVQFHIDHSAYPEENTSFPYVLILFLKNKPQKGGLSKFVKAQDAYQCYKETYPTQDPFNLKITLTAKSNNTQPLTCPIFKFDNDKNLNIRCNMNSQASFEGQTKQKLNDIFEKVQVKKQLKQREGYILINTRWLHGRDDFIGFRKVHRMMVR